MADFRIVLVGPKFPGNVGAIARSMANFGLRDLVLVNPSCELDDDAYRRAKHGSFILEDVRIVSSLDEALEGCFLVAGTSGVTTKGDSNYTRIPVPVREFAEGARGYEQKIAFVFGREDIGLLQEELEHCDVLVWVPTGDEFPILNLSHAATIVMYEMYQADHVPRKSLPASREQKERLFSTFDDLMDEVGYPVNRRNGTRVMFRRMMGRSIPSEYEFRTIMGVIGDAVRIIRNGKPWEKKD
ncbi:MAG: RNA methyltransferase [Thermoplasmata archaeon]|nr:RNA methyltransferase [Thermoplasmata archaeon]